MQIGQKIGGIWHGFSGSFQVAQDLIDLGFKLGVGPILLRDNARKLPELVKTLPGSAFVLETDYPDMAESPQSLLQVAQKVAELRDSSLEEAVRMTTQNASWLFGFKELFCE
jgi:TatD DNase family protein